MTDEHDMTWLQREKERESLLTHCNLLCLRVC